MKTIELIDLLTNKEKKEFLFVMKNNKRKGTHKLLEALLRQKITKQEEIYKAVFDKEYEEKKDFMLRNELRLLNQHLEHFIACKAMTTKEEKFLFIKALQKKGVDDLFNKEVHKEIKKRNKDNDYQALIKLYELVLDQYKEQRTFNTAKLEKMMNLNEQILFFKKKSSLYEERASHVSKAFLIRTINLSAKNIAFEDIKHIPKKYDDAYLSYLKHKAYSYVRFGEEKRASLKAALSLIDQINFYDFDKQFEKVVMLSNLALDYLFAFDYQNAIAIYEQLIPFIEPSGIVRYSILFNYLNCLLKAKEFSKAINLIESDFSNLEGVPPALSGKLDCIIAMARVFTGELVLAYADLSPDTKKSVRNDYFYSRLVLTIIFYLEENIELAKRENNNILQLIEDDKDLLRLKICAKFFRTFLALEDTPSSNLKKRKHLCADVNNFINPKNKGSDILPLLWLKERLD